MNCGADSRAIRAYTIRVAVSILIYVGVLLGVITLFNGPHPPSGVLATFFAILPALPVIATFWAIARLLVEMSDEYQRILLVKQILIATALTLSISTMWGFLENFDRVEHLSAYYVAMLWFVMFALGGVLARFRG